MIIEDAPVPASGLHPLDLLLFAEDWGDSVPIPHVELQVWPSSALDQEGLPPFHFTQRQRERAKAALGSDQPFFDRVSLTLFLPISQGELRLGVVGLLGVPRTLDPEEAHRWMPLLRSYLLSHVQWKKMEKLAGQHSGFPDYLNAAYPHLPWDRGVLCHLMADSVSTVRAMEPQRVAEALQSLGDPLWVGGRAGELWFFLGGVEPSEIGPRKVLDALMGAGIRWLRCFIHNFETVSRPLQEISRDETALELMGATAGSTHQLYSLLDRYGLSHPGLVRDHVESRIPRGVRPAISFSPGFGQTLEERFRVQDHGGRTELERSDFPVGTLSTAAVHIERRRWGVGAMWAYVHAAMLGQAGRVWFDHVTWQVWGDQLYSWEDLKGAVWAYRRGLNMRPDHGPTWNSLGVCLVSMGRRRAALRAFVRSAELDPGDHEVQYNLGSLYLQMGDPSRAVEHLEEAMRLSPGQLIVAVRLAEALAAKGDDALGFRVLSPFAKQEGLPQLFHRLYGLAAVAAGEWREAKEHLKRALQADDSDRDVLLSLALAYLEDGGGREAVLRLKDRAKGLPDQWTLSQKRLLERLEAAK